MRALSSVRENIRITLMVKWKYIRIKAPEEYPGRTDRGWILEHHLVWWKHTGRLVPKGHHLHHVDGDPQNNTLSNLQILTASEHSRVHGQVKAIRWVKLQCPACNQVFEREYRQSHLSKPEQRVTLCSRSCRVPRDFEGESKVLDVFYR